MKTHFFKIVVMKLLAKYYSPKDFNPNDLLNATFEMN